MAVKQHEIVHDTSSEVDLELLVQYVKLFDLPTLYLPPPTDIVSYCEDIVKCLALAYIPRESDGLELFLSRLYEVEGFLREIVQRSSAQVQEDIIFAILRRLFAIISNPQSSPCPAACVVLSLVQGDMIPTAIKWQIKDGESMGKNGPGGLRSMLMVFYQWLCNWEASSSLSEWTLTFIKALEVKGRFDILVDISLDFIVKLFESLRTPTVIQQAVAPVFCHVLAALRGTPAALDKIAPKVRGVLEALASDSSRHSSQSSRQLLQNIVDIISALINEQDEQQCSSSDEIGQDVKQKYADIIACLDTHMASKSCQFMTIKAWKMEQPNSPARLKFAGKVGLSNPGNTCYMNSVVQALLLTKQFSNYTMLNMSSMPFWTSMSHVFGLMRHSMDWRLDPSPYFVPLKPDHFTVNQQHDSSEFLSHLLERLHAQELIQLKPGERAGSSVATKTMSSSAVLTTSDGEPECKWPRMSPPRADSSTGDKAGSTSVMPKPPKIEESTSSSSMKRTYDEPHSSAPVLKRRLLRHLQTETQNSLSDTFVQNTFGGVLVTKINCADCNSTSVRRDMFRDLHLAFPDKPTEQNHRVQSLLDFYCSTEHLSGDNQYCCANCGGLRDAERSVVIESPPKYLILVLKNFRYNLKNHKQTKLIHTIHQDFQIDLPVVHPHGQHSSYELYAAVIHTGTTLDSGHYYTVGRDDNQWYIYNDEEVEPCTETFLAELNSSSTPYILFYKRTDIKETEGPSLEELPPNVRNAVEACNKYFD